MNFSLSADLDCVFIISLLRVEQKVINSELKKTIDWQLTGLKY